MQEGDADPDGDGLGEYADTDSDNDGLLDQDEDLNQNAVRNVGETDLYDPDTDDDGLMDGDEVHTFLTDPIELDTEVVPQMVKLGLDDPFDPTDLVTPTTMA